MKSGPLTPDFYSYEWLTPSSVETDGDDVVLKWADGATLRAHRLWLWENDVSRGAIDLATREGLIDPAELSLDIVVSAATIDSSGALAVSWQASETVSQFHPGWLHHVAVGLHRPQSWLPEAIVWNSASLPSPPSHDLVGLTAGSSAAVNDLLRYGLTRLTNCPADPNFLEDLVPHFGPLQDSSFGQIWDVKVEVDPISTANTTLRLGPHTDLPSRETPPGIQMLHCLENTCVGGLSQMTDGLAVAAHIAEAEPEMYEALTTLRWIFFSRGPEVDHRWSGPLIDLGVEGSPVTFRAFYPVRAFPDMDPQMVSLAYESMRLFSSLAGSSEYQISYQFEPGDVVIFDNRRILHGRSAYAGAADSRAQDGRRHLRGCYLSHDDLLSKARVRRRRTDLV